MDDLAERAAVYAGIIPRSLFVVNFCFLSAFYVAPNRDDVMKMVKSFSF